MKVEMNVATYIFSKLPSIQKKLLDHAKDDPKLMVAYAMDTIINITTRSMLHKFMEHTKLTLDELNQVKREMVDLGWEEGWEELTWLKINRKRWEVLRLAFGDNFIILIAENNGDYVTFDRDADYVVRLGLTMHLGRGNVHDDYSHFHFCSASFDSLRSSLKNKGKGVIVV